MVCCAVLSLRPTPEGVGFRSLRVTCDERPQTAQECADACDVPLSTVYRKLGTLTDAALLASGCPVCGASVSEAAFASLSPGL